MPFTLSHPAAAALAWPLVRRGVLPLAALAVGAMVPDFEFFLHLRPEARWSHSLGGLVAFCVPVGLLVYVLWELAMRGPTRHLLALEPSPSGRRASVDARWVARAAAGVLVGAASHLAWDGFTHGGYWGAALLPALRSPAFTLGDRSVPWFNLLQHASTIGGGLVVLAWLGRELRRAAAPRVLLRPSWRWTVFAGLLGASLLGALLNSSRGGVPSDYWRAQLWLGRAAVGAMLAFFLGLLAYGVVGTVGQRARAT